MTIIDKTLIKKQFDYGLNTYSREAIVQKRIANELILELSSFFVPSNIRLFEIGCGTGFLTQKIIENIELDELIVNDITNTSMNKIQELIDKYDVSHKFIKGDAEEIDYPTQIDVVLSSSTIQWFKNKQLFFDKVFSSLNPDGIFAFSTFGCDNYKEIKSLTGVGLEYQSMEEITEMLSHNFKIISSSEWIEKKEFDTPLSVLRHIKQTGVNAIQKTYFGKQKLLSFTENYKHRFSISRNKVSLTYNPIIIIAQKK